MISIQKADESNVDGIVRVCTAGQWATYGDLYTKEYIERVIAEFYNRDRVLKEVTTSTQEWGGYFVALDTGEVVGAGGGGMTGDDAGEVYVLYMDPDRRGEGVGTKLLEAITEQQKEFGAITQWVSVQKGNEKGIPFYEARGFQYDSEQTGYANKEDDKYISVRYSRKV